MIQTLKESQITVFLSVALLAGCERAPSSPIPEDVYIIVDANRDGRADIDSTSDLSNRQNASVQAGAIILPNIGDTGQRCPDSTSTLSDDELEQCHDASDNVPRATENFAPVHILPFPDDTQSASLTIDEDSKSQVRLFALRDGDWQYIESGAPLTPEELVSGATLGIDARDVVRDKQAWSGIVTLAVEASTSQKNITDYAQLKVAPVITYNHTEDAKVVLSSQSGESANHKVFIEDLRQAVAESGIETPVKLMSTIDNWAQDYVEFGYLSMPKPDGKRAIIQVAMRSTQPGRVGGRAVFDFKGPGFGAIQLGGEGYHQVDSFGNLETVPPYSLGNKTYPVGRIIYGDAGDGISPHKDWRNFFASQEIQDPIILDTSWLAIGHVDEFVQFVPADTPRGWKMTILSPELLIRMLEKAVEEGYGDVLAYSKPGHSDRTISDILNNKKLMAENQFAQQKINENKALLVKELGLSNDEIIEIPGIVKQAFFDEEDLADFAKVDYKGPEDDMEITYGPGKLLSAHPGAINGIVIDETHYISPQQFGPVIEGVDILQSAVTNAYKQGGLDVTYVDDWYTHHAIAGEVHCGTNTIREIGSQWW